jgi:hypothetical protein
MLLEHVKTTVSRESLSVHLQASLELAISKMITQAIN